MKDQNVSDKDVELVEKLNDKIKLPFAPKEPATIESSTTEKSALNYKRIAAVCQHAILPNDTSQLNDYF